MKVSELWLREWVKPHLQIKDLANQLTMAGLEVDALYPVAKAFSNIIVGEVVETKPHPQANRLTCCIVDTGQAKLNIVCGASNVRPKLKVALAMIGAKLPSGMEIKAAKLRGEPSEGMLCSASELGMEDASEGIIELPEDAPLGVDLRQYLSLDDHVLDIDLTPNRGDCLSIKGIARELAAINRIDLISPVIEPVPVKLNDTLTVNLQQTEACPYYCGRIIKGIDNTRSLPLWLKERLRRVGVRSVHPVVDITNYVMLELGQPMHAFDYNSIQGNLHVRYAKDEELVLLNDQCVNLNQDVLVIDDDQKTLAIAGIMGGKTSSVTEHTQNIFLESAHFNPIALAGIARRYGINSDSAQRFERGVDPSLVEIALQRASHLIITLLGGEAGPLVVQCQKDKLPQQTTIRFNPDHVKSLTGVSITDEEMTGILEFLGMKLEKHEAYWLVTRPTYRFDIELEVDLIEEIIRLFGYQHIQSSPALSMVSKGQDNLPVLKTEEIGFYFCNRGYHEIMSYSFVDPTLQQFIFAETEVLRLLNPISEELSEMRISLWPGLIAAALYNLNRQQNSIKLFESGVIFEISNGKLQEKQVFAGLMVGEQGSLNWSEQTRWFDFFDLKGDLEGLFYLLKQRETQFVAHIHPALHPGKSCQIMLQGRHTGWLGVLHPKICSELGIEKEVIVFECELSPFCTENLIRYQSISKYPQIRRDLSLLMDKKISAQQIESIIKTQIPFGLLKSLHVFDVYSGPNIPENKKSLAIALTLQDEQRTLIDEEVNQFMDAVIQSLKNELDITLRN